METAWIGFLGSVIVAVLGLVGVVITNSHANEKMLNVMKTQQAVTDTKIEELTREVREHNNFARRIPVLEEQIVGLSRRIEGLEQKGGGAK